MSNLRAMTFRGLEQLRPTEYSDPQRLIDIGIVDYCREMLTVNDQYYVAAQQHIQLTAQRALSKPQQSLQHSVVRIAALIRAIALHANNLVDCLQHPVRLQQSDECRKFFSALKCSLLALRGEL